MSTIPIFNFELARGWLEKQYDPELQLFRAAPNAEPTTYYLYNDNLLAGFITGNDLTIARVFHQGTFPRPRIVSVFGQSGAILQPNTVQAISTIGVKVVRTEVPYMEAPPLSVSDYADIAFYNVLDLYNQGQNAAAATAFTAAEAAFWDGVGFKDKSFMNSYALYKDALYVICAGRINTPDRTVTPLHLQECLTAIAMAQRIYPLNTRAQNQHGGVLTDIDTYGNPTGDTNVETLVLSWMAYHWHYRAADLST